MGHQPWAVDKLNQLQLKTVYQFRLFSLEGARLKWGRNPNFYNNITLAFWWKSF